MLPGLAAVAASIVAVSCFAGGHHAVLSDPVWPPKAESKLASLGLAENIHIADGANAVDHCDTAFKIGVNLLVDIASISEAFSKIVRAEAVDGLLDRLFSAPKLISRGICPQSVSEPYLQFMGGSLAVVLDFYSEFRLPILSRDFAIFGKDIGPELPARSILSALNEPVGGPPELPGSQAKNTSNQPQDDGEGGDYALSVDPFKRAAPRKRAPFLPVFGAGALTFLASMFGGVYVYERGGRLRGWRQQMLKALACLLFVLGSFSFVFGFPWAALL